MANIEEFKLSEKIKIAYIKCRGEITGILKELNYPTDEEHISLIKKHVARFKKQESRDVSVLISNTLMQHLMLGYQSRIHNLMEMLKVLEGRDQLEVSTCCESPVRHNDNNIYTCLTCNLRCNLKKIDKEGILDIKLGVLEQLREEDKALVEFAEKMGYTNKKEFPPAPQVNQNVIILKEGGKEVKIIEEMSELGPLERDTLIQKLEKRIAEGEVVETPVEKKDETNTI
jgi:hypothetical protein